MVGAMHFAREKDALVVWSSGDSCEKRDDQLLPPAADVEAADSWLSHALVVAASDSNNRDACWSRMGGVVNLAAPGDGIGWGSGTGSGTSYSAPLVTGAAGLVRALNDTLSAPETRAILIRSANVALTPRTEAENRAVAHDECMSFPASDSTFAADTPRGILNLDTTVETALLTQGLGLETKPSTVLSMGGTAEVTVDVPLPPAGVNALDIAFVIDQSGSYFDDIDTLQAQASRIIDDLNGRGHRRAVRSGGLRRLLLLLTPQQRCRLSPLPRPHVGCGPGEDRDRAARPPLDGWRNHRRIAARSVVPGGDRIRARRERGR